MSIKISALLLATLSGASATVAITGSWHDAWGTSVTIGAAAYISIYAGGEPSIVGVTQYSNAEGWLVGQNSGAGSYNPGMWSRVDWVVDAAGGLHVCTSHYDAANESVALTPNANHSAYATSGCGGFGFSALTPTPTGPLAIMGSWADAWGTAIEVSSTMCAQPVGSNP